MLEMVQTISNSFQNNWHHLNIFKGLFWRSKQITCCQEIYRVITMCIESTNLQAHFRLQALFLSLSAKPIQILSLDRALLWPHNISAWFTSASRFRQIKCLMVSSTVKNTMVPINFFSCRKNFFSFQWPEHSAPTWNEKLFKSLISSTVTHITERNLPTHIR